MKSRLTLADVLAEVRDLRNLILDMRLINIFDVDDKTFLLKFAQHESKHILLIESGIRMHTTLYARDKPVQPSPFTMKLRKHLRNKRLTSITQVGVDRVVDLAFGSGELTHHLIVELYDKGNIVLTDGEYTILSLLRGYTLEVGGKAEAEADAAPDAAVPGPGTAGHTAAAGGQGMGDRVRIAVKAKYVWAANTSLVRGAAVDDGSDSTASVHISPLDATHPPPTLAHALALYMSQYEASVLPTLSAKARKKLTLSALLCTKGSGVDVYGPMLVEHALASAGVQGGRVATLAALRGKGWVQPKADPKDKTGVVPVLSADAYLSSYDPDSLLNAATALNTLPSLLHRLGTVPEAGYALVQPLQGGGTATQGLDSLMAGMSMGSDGKAVAKPTASSSSSSVTFPSTGGCIGTWQEVQDKARQGVIQTLAGGATAEAVVPSALASDSTPTESAAAPAASVPAVAEEDSIGTGTQLPPTLPFAMVDLTPALLAQHAGACYVTFSSFDSACDAYFSRLDVARAEKAESQAKAAAAKRLARIKEGHAENLQALSQAQQLAYRKARLLEHWSEDVDKACLVVRSALEHGVKWIDLLHLIEAEQARRNPIAKLIVPTHMDLGRGRITVALVDTDAVEEEQEAKREERRMAKRLQGLDSDEEDEDEAEDEQGESDDDEEDEGDADSSDGSVSDHATRPNNSGGKGQKGGNAKEKGNKGKGKDGLAAGAAGDGGKSKDKGKEKAEQAIAKRMTGSKHSLLVEVDVLQTAAANASAYYGAGKGAREKEARTLQAAEQAIKKAEKTVAAAAAREIAAASASRAIRVARKPSWFERFHWFITSEGLVCVAGKSAEDNELLWRKYLRPQDAYVHADAHGAATVVLRNISTDPASVQLLPPLSLQQAGAFCICLSSSWGSNTPTGAWWVKAEQVSKTAPSGEYLTTGSFMIRGKKNPLPPTRLELGLCLVWKVDEVCVDRHMGDRRVRGAIGDVEQADREKESDDGGESGREGEDKKEASLSAEAMRRLARRQARREEAAAAAAVAPGPSPSPEHGEAHAEAEAVDGSTSSSEGEQHGAGDAAALDAPTDSGAAGGATGDAQAGAGAGGGGGAGDGTPRGLLPAHIKRAAKKLEKKGLPADQAIQRALAEDATKRAKPGPAPTAAEGATDKEEGGGGEDAGEVEEEGKEKKGAAADSKHGQQKRGQRGKLKKLKEKYADQDQEDREVALLALGHKGTPAPATAALTPAVQAKEEALTKADGKLAAGGQSKGSARPAREKGAGKGKGGVGGEAEAGEGGEESTNQDETRLLASLVAWPTASDILLHAIPMLCPYSVAITAKYRCKLTPGPLKKGKAGQAVLHLWSQTARAPPAGQGTERERELLRTVGDTELVAALVGGCRVSAAPPASGPAGAGPGK